MSADNALGDYLRARRETVRPADVGLGVTGRRRVPGLRRSELATLAGVSIEYYARLEQGRDRHPSRSVAESLAQTLRLDQDATAHLFALAELAPPPRARAGAAPIPEEILALLRSFEGVTPAYVYSQLTEVLAANAFARIVLPTLQPGNNFIRGIFLSEDMQRLYVNVEDRRAAAVANLRFRAALHPDEEKDKFVAEMCQASEDFRRLWSHYEVAGEFRGAALMVIRHPQAGRLELLHHKLIIPGADGLGLGLLHAEPDSDSERALATLRPADISSEAVGAPIQV